MRMNFRPMARAMLLPRLVLPTPGGPAKQRMGPETSLFELLHGQELEHPVLHVFQVVVVLVEDLARVGDVEVVLGETGSRAARRSSRGRCG